mmetsp:Transcript_64761/g.76686  ORF Transcript_64761/g.76686 Transcript_64761/m.76686 type:complete len:102 (+) Transcript_64761:544-849(+)
MVRLLGRTPRLKQDGNIVAGQQLQGQFPGNKSKNKEKDASKSTFDNNKNSSTSHEWLGSILGAEWDDRVGLGAVASSILGRILLCGWKIISSEVPHPFLGI